MLCSNCNDEERSAETACLVFDTKEIEVDLCEPCREEFEAKDWIEAADPQIESTAS